MKRSAPLHSRGFSTPRREAKVIEYAPRPRPVAQPVAALLATKPVPKAVAFRSDAWLAAVRTIPCVKCGRTGVQAAHRNEEKGMGIKADDSLTAALCHEHHAEIDQGSGMTREQRRAEIDRAIVLTVKALARAGRLSIVEA